ncbi:MAG TPA: DivIVA domain-containing protein [Propionibacteriaceae bacterium]
MSLSLDDVRNKRFRMARKSGYEVLEVDEFVDEVEETFAQLIEENQNLKKQVEALKAAPATSTQTAPAAPVVQDASPPPTPAPAPTPAPVVEAKTSSVPGAVVVTTSKEASAAVVRLVEMSTDQAERLVDEATDDANRIREEANRTAHQVTTDARTRAERVESEARVNAERVQADALGRAEKLDREIESRRSEMFGDLEKQRDDLTDTVASLRSFEATYRTNLTSHLRSQIDALESGKSEPVDAPEVARVRAVDSNRGSANGHAEDRPADHQPQDRDDAPTLGGGGPSSDTPRLDALLGDQR